MQSEVDFSKLLISSPGGAGDEYESAGDSEEVDPYIKWLKIDFALECEDGENPVSVCGGKERVNPIGSLFGALILGTQSFRDGWDFVSLCDECSGDLCVMATDLENEGLLENFHGECNNVFYIYTLELSQGLIDASNLREFFDRLPRLIFQYTGVMPQLCCNLVADVDDFYEKMKKKTEYDSRSVG